MLTLKNRFVRDAASAFLCISLALSTQVFGQNIPKGIKYLGGPGFDDEAIKKVKGSWDNSMMITEEQITLSFKKNQLPMEEIPISNVTRITYGQATTRRVGKWIAVGILLAPVALFGIFHKSRQHRVLIEWTDGESRDRGMLMQVHKDQFVGLLNGLAFQSRQPIYSDADDKEWLFKNGVRAELDDQSSDDQGPGD